MCQPSTHANGARLRLSPARVSAPPARYTTRRRRSGSPMFTSSTTTSFGKIARPLVGRLVAIELDGVVESAPEITRASPGATWRSPARSPSAKRRISQSSCATARSRSTCSSFPRPPQADAGSSKEPSPRRAVRRSTSGSAPELPIGHQVRRRTRAGRSRAALRQRPGQPHAADRLSSDAPMVTIIAGWMAPNTCVSTANA